jgi:hypothetical protein
MMRRKPKTERPKTRGGRKLVNFLAALLIGGLAGGFIAFASYVDNLETPTDLPETDGVVVWTGPGGGRLEMAGALIDVDYAALDTRGNARETAAWAEALGYDHIILVTSSYHMPRARVEIGYEMAGLRITPVPVRNEARNQWWNDAGRFRRVGSEYGKYLLVMARGRPKGDNMREPVLPEDALITPTEDET